MLLSKDKKEDRTGWSSHLPHVRSIYNVNGREFQNRNSADCQGKISEQVEYLTVLLVEQNRNY